MEPIQPMEPMALSTLERLRQNNILQAWLVLTLAICFGAALAGIHVWLSPRIEQNKINETLEKVPELVLGAKRAEKMAEAGKSLKILPRDIQVAKNKRVTFYKVYQARHPGGNLAGWVIKSKGQGYADKIELLLGLSPAAKKITGLYILEQKETPGLGNKIVTEKWRSQFIGKPAKALSVTKEGAETPTEVDAITGATISSRSVTQIINTALRDLDGKLSAKAKGK